MARTLAYKTIDINNFNNIRRRSTSPSKISSRSFLISSTTSSILYHKKIKINNDLPNEKLTEPVNSSQLLYKDNSREDISVSKVTDNSSTRNQQHVLNKTLSLKSMFKPWGKDINSKDPNMSHADNIINVQISYDPNQLIKLKL